MLEDSEVKQDAKQFVIAEATWAEGMQTDKQACELTDELKSCDGNLVIRCQRHAAAERAAKRIYAEWAARLGEAAPFADEVDSAEADRHRGGGSGFAARRARARSTPGRARVEFGPGTGAF